MVLPYRGPNGSRSKCRVRIYEPDDPLRDAHVIIVSELADNPGTSVTNAAAEVAAEVVSLFRLGSSDGPHPVFIEHHENGARGTAEDPHTFDLVAFSDYRMHKTTRGGATRRVIGEPSWKPLDRSSAERLVGGPL